MEEQIPLLLINHPTFSIMEEREKDRHAAYVRTCEGGYCRTGKGSSANVLALGHHKDDAVETVLLNLFYGGR